MARLRAGIITWAPIVVAMAFAAAAQTTPEIKRLYLSQGEWRGSSLTASGRRILADVASATAPNVVTEIDINGMADLAPNPASQKRVSDARVDATRAEFVRLGVADGDIGVEPVTTSDGGIPALAGDLLAKRVVIVVHY